MNWDLKLNIKFEEEEIMTNVKEILCSKSLDELPDFFQKFQDGKISFAKIKGMNLRKKLTQQMMENPMSSKCCICFHFNENLTIFQECTHFI